MAGWAAVLAAIGLLSCTPPSEPPSILLIVIDTQRADYLGFGGFRGAISPELDAFAEQSVRFTRCYASAPWTKPSMASLFTSTWPHQHGLTNHEGRLWGGPSEAELRGVLPPQARTLAECLHDAGFATAAFVSNPWLALGYGFEQGFDRYDVLHHTPKVRADSVLHHAETWLTQRTDGPWFAYVHLMDVHGPYDADPRYLERVSQAPGVDTVAALSRRDVNEIPEYLREQPWAAGWERYRLSTWRAQYAAGVASLDDQLGTALRRWDETGLLANTVVVITADHGEELFDHGGWDHGKTLYEEQVRVPLLIRFPGHEPSGRVDAVARLVDVMPTLLTRVGVQPPDPATLAGRDLSPLWAAEDEAPRPVLLGATREEPQARGMVIGSIKILAEHRGVELAVYNLALDPGERRNLALYEPGMADSVHAVLEALIQATGPGLPSATHPAPELDPELRERLRALGYLN